MFKLFIRKYFASITFMINLWSNTLLDSPEHLKLNGNWYQNADIDTNYVMKFNTFQIPNPLEAQYFFEIFTNTQIVENFLNTVINPNTSTQITDVSSVNYYTNTPGKPLILQYVYNGKNTELILSVTENYESHMQRFYTRINERKNPKTPIKYITFYTGHNLKTTGKNISLFSSSLDLKTSSISKIDNVLDEIIINVPEIAKINTNSKIKIGQSSTFLSTNGLQWLKFLTIATFQNPINGKYIISKNDLNDMIEIACKAIEQQKDYIEWSNKMFPSSYQLISDIRDYVIPQNIPNKPLVDSIKENTKSLLKDSTINIPCITKIHSICTDINEEMITIKQTLQKLDRGHGQLDSSKNQITAVVDDINGEIKKTILNDNAARSNKILSYTTSMVQKLEKIDESLRDTNVPLNPTEQDTESEPTVENNITETQSYTVYERLSSMHEIITGIRSSMLDLYGLLPDTENIANKYTAITEASNRASQSHKNLSEKASDINETLDGIKVSLDSLNALLNADSNIQKTLNTLTQSVSNLSSKNSPFINKLNLIIETAQFKDNYNLEELHDEFIKLPFKSYNSISYWNKTLMNNPQLVFYVTAKILAAPTIISEINDEFQAMTTQNGTLETSLNYIYRNRIAVFYEAFKTDIFNAIIQNYCNHFEGNRPNSVTDFKTLLAKEFKDTFIHAFISICGLATTHNILGNNIVKPYIDDLFDTKITFHTSQTEERWESTNDVIANLKARNYDNASYTLENLDNPAECNILTQNYENILKNSPYLIFGLWAQYTTAPIHIPGTSMILYSEEGSMRTQLMISGNTVLANKHILLNRLIVCKDAFKDFWFENNNINKVSDKNIFIFQHWTKEILETAHKPQYINLLTNKEIIELNIKQYYENTKYHGDLSISFPN